MPAAGRRGRDEEGGVFFMQRARGPEWTRRVPEILNARKADATWEDAIMIGQSLHRRHPDPNRNLIQHASPEQTHHNQVEETQTKIPSRAR